MAAQFIPKLAVNRPTAVMMLFLAMLVIGAIAYLQIPLELLPAGYTPPFLYLQIPTRQSTPSDVEQEIAIPTEEMLNTVRHIKRLKGRVMANSAGFLIEFQDGTDMDLAYNQVRDRLERLMPDLPEEVGHPFIWKYDPNADPIFWVGITFDEELSNPHHFIELNLVRKLERVAGVSTIEMNGADEKIISIDIDQKLASSANVGTYQLVRQLMGDNFALSSGELYEDDRLFPVRVMARYETIQDIQRIPVGKESNLQDVGTVSYDFEKEDTIHRINGKKGVFITVFKEAEANTVEVCKNLETYLKEIKKDPKFKNFTFHFFFNQGNLITDSLDNLTDTALLGGFFAVIILFLFLKRPRTTLIVSLGIPISLLITVIVLYFTNNTLNVLSLMGLMLSVGMVVDNGIVVIENIQRFQTSGKSRKEAAISGASEVGLAILVATTTTVVVFLPLIFSSGNETLSFFLGKIGVPVIVSLLASLVVSLVLIPPATTRLAQSKVVEPGAVMKLLEKGYASGLKWILSHRTDAFVIMAVLMFSITIPMENIKKADEASSNINDFRLRFNFPSNYNLEQKNDYFKALEQNCKEQWADLEIKDMVVSLGGRRSRPEVRVFLNPPEERKKSRDEIIKEFTELIPESPGVEWKIGWGRGGSGDSSSVTVTLVGPSSARLAELSVGVIRRLKEVPGVVSIDTDIGETGSDELLFTMDRDNMNRSGLSPTIVGGTVDYALRGRRLPNFHGRDHEIEMWVKVNEADRDELSDLNRMDLQGTTGTRTRLDTVTNRVFSKGYGQINRENGKTVLAIQLSTTEDDLKALSEEIDKVLAGIALPRGYRIEKGNRFKKMEENEDTLSSSLLMAIVFVFLLMAILFESLVIPFSILLSVPFALLGVYWLLYITQTTMDVMAGVGMVILVGIVVNNAIVMVDRVQQLRRQGLERKQALIQGGCQRLRPILMTALTTICGLIPMALGSAGLIGIPYAPLGRTVIGGLIASTFLTLFVVPLFYTFFDDISRKVAQFAIALVRKKTKETSP